MTLGGSNTICLSPGASCSGGCRQNTLEHGFPLPGACEWLPSVVSNVKLPLGLICCQGFHLTPATLPGRCFTAPALRTSTTQPRGPQVIIGCPNTCRSNPMATDPPSASSKPNGSVDCSPTENGLQTLQWAGPRRARVSQL